MDHRRLDRTNGKDSTLSEKKHFIVPHEPTVYSCNCGYNSWFLESVKEHLEVENALARYKVFLKKRIEALEQFATESAFASDDFDEEDTWISRKAVLAEIEKN